MGEPSVLEREEFTQNYLQYRWLDDTRTRYLDRYLIVAVGYLAARLQFASILAESVIWRAVIDLGFVLFAVLMARSIVLFRRQQRGHGLYIDAVRRHILDNQTCDLSQFEQHMQGKNVHVTAWVDLFVAVSATLAPLVLVDLAFGPSQVLSRQWATVASAAAVLGVLLGIWLLVVPCARYNFANTLDWKS